MGADRLTARRLGKGTRWIVPCEQPRHTCIAKGMS